jgi:hypothetical protein
MSRVTASREAPDKPEDPPSCVPDAAPRPEGRDRPHVVNVISIGLMTGRKGSQLGEGRVTVDDVPDMRCRDIRSVRAVNSISDAPIAVGKVNNLEDGALATQDAFHHHCSKIPRKSILWKRPREARLDLVVVTGLSRLVGHRFMSVSVCSHAVRMRPFGEPSRAAARSLASSGCPRRAAQPRTLDGVRSR